MRNTLISSLLQGSHNIDRMRSEIDQIVNMLLGMPCLRHLNDRTEKVIWVVRSKASTNDDYIWVLSLPIGSTSIKATFARGNEEFPELYYDSQSGSRDIKLENVQTVHKNLELFVETMLDKYPALVRATQPLFEAARI